MSNLDEKEVKIFEYASRKCSDEMNLVLIFDTNQEALCRNNLYNYIQ